MAHTEKNVTTYDFVVIGGGTSGAVAARRLAEGDANCSVCLLEAGPSNVDVLNSQMPGGWQMMPNGTPDWCFETIPQNGCNNRVISVPRGRLLGGCSTMNGTYLIRGTKADYDRMADMGNPGWSWEEMLPFFKAFEAFHPTEWHQADFTVRGTDGPIETEIVRPAPISEKVMESFIDKGFEYKPDMFVQGAYEGVGHVARTTYKGIRSTSANYIHSYKKTNLTVKTGVFVDRIILEKNNNTGSAYKAISVEAHDDANGQAIQIKARREIVLSAGAYNSPMILMHSGIGPAEHLAQVGIDCKVDLSGVGENLQDHIMAYTSYEVNDSSLTYDQFVYHHPDALAAAIKEWHATKTGVMTCHPVGCVALTRLDKIIQDPVWKAAKAEKQSRHEENDDPTGQLPKQPHVEFIVTQLYMGAPHTQAAGGVSYNPVNGEGVFSLMTFLCGPQARGTVRLSSNDPTSKPIIDHAYLDNDLDVAVLAEGCRLGHEVMMHGRGTKDIISSAWPKKSSHPADMAGWKEHVRAFTNTGYHASGTCKMAPESDPMGVVDSRLRVRGVAGLQVADVSILPILNNGHTQSPAYAIGEKVAHMVLQDADISK